MPFAQSMNSSVALIVFAVNDEHDTYLNKTIESALQQTYKEFVLYVCCEGSTARISKVIESHIGEQPRIYLSNYVRNSALISTIEATETLYFGLLDSGDILLPEALEKAVNAIRTKPDIGMVDTDYVVIGTDGRVEKNVTSSNTQHSEKKLLTDFIVNASQFRLIRRSTYNEVGGINNRLPYCQDYDLILKLSEVSKLLHINELLFHQRKRERDISYEKQIERIFWAREIAAQALRRRGMAQEYELEAELLPKYYLINRAPSDEGTIQ